MIPLGCLIFVSPLASHVKVLYLCESPCLSRWGALFVLVPWPLTFRSAWFLWVPLPLTMGCFTFVSPLASHVRGALFLWVPLPLTLGCFVCVSSLASHVSGCLIFVSPLASHVGVLYFCESPCLSCFGVLYFRESPCDLDCRFSGSRIPQWFFSVFFSYSVHQIT